MHREGTHDEVDSQSEGKHIALLYDRSQMKKGKTSMAQTVPPRTRYMEEEASGLANPLPLGLIALAFATALIGSSFARFLAPLPMAGIGLIVAASLCLGGVVQILAGIWTFGRHAGMGDLGRYNTLAATIFTAYGGFLLALGTLFLLPTFGTAAAFGTGAIAGTINHILALFFLCWAITCGVLLLAALKSSSGLTLVMGLLFLSYLCLFVGELVNAFLPILIIGGIFGMICALVAWYSALGWLLRSTGSPLHLPFGEWTAPYAPPRGYGSEPAV
jgi:succinate-acetate transporter protein